jgi:1-deoxy-D-xylulose 5-phosphate reductoisomerase
MQPLPVHQTKPRSITILGSTGSIGTSTIKLLNLHKDKFRVEAPMKM